jgi:hypothetical protein
MMKIHYIPTPVHCDVCNYAFAHEVGTEMFDAYIPRFGMWGNVCRRCADHEGVTLGIGRGQRYELQNDGRFLQVEGGSGS